MQIHDDRSLEGFQDLRCSSGLHGSHSAPIVPAVTSASSPKESCADFTAIYEAGESECCEGDKDRPGTLSSPSNGDISDL